jgi:DNA-directed RNA polymerase subunit E"
MAKKKACKNCKLLVDGDKCPICKSSSFASSWLGRIFISDVERSMIANKINVKVKGEYAIKVR